ncbi:MAG: cob(I)yrinic acid a,c-diamide adenosyltransferase [Deltaproteobacteria bacterium]
MKIYTKTGDGGETSLFGGGRVAKDDARVEAYGAVDELNAALGLARALSPVAEIDVELARIQAELFAVGAELATPREARAHESIPGVRAEWAEALERQMDRWDAVLPPLTAFVLPGGAPVAAALHVARGTCRRAERRAVALSHLAPIDPNVVVYLNRLSDFLFEAARAANLRAGVTEILWQPRKDR